MGGYPDRMDEQSGRRTPRWRRRRAELITDARRSPSDDRHHREKAYAWIQGLRIPFLLLSMMTYLWWENWIISAALFVISVPLPWIAVVVANGRGEPRDKRAGNVYKPALAREQQQQFELENRRQRELPEHHDTIDHEENP